LASHVNLFRLLAFDAFPSVVIRATGSHEGVREERWCVTARAVALALEQLPTSLLLVAQGLGVARLEAVPRRVTAKQCSLVRRERLHDSVRRRPLARESRIKQGFVVRLAADLVGLLHQPLFSDSHVPASPRALRLRL